MTEIIKEYGEGMLAMTGAVGIFGVAGTLFWNQNSLFWKFILSLLEGSV